MFDTAHRVVFTPVQFMKSPVSALFNGKTLNLSHPLSPEVSIFEAWSISTLLVSP